MDSSKTKWEIMLESSCSAVHIMKQREVTRRQAKLLKKAVWTNLIPERA